MPWRPTPITTARAPRSRLRSNFRTHNGRLPCGSRLFLDKGTIEALPQTPLRDFIPQTPILASRLFESVGKKILRWKSIGEFFIVGSAGTSGSCPCLGTGSPKFSPTSSFSYSNTVLLIRAQRIAMSSPTSPEPTARAINFSPTDCGCSHASLPISSRKAISPPG